MSDDLGLTLGLGLAFGLLAISNLCILLIVRRMEDDIRRTQASLLETVQLVGRLSPPTARTKGGEER